MPSRNPQTGKRVGGAEQQRLKKAAQERERQRQGDGTTGFEALPPVDISDTAKLISWAAKVQALAIQRAIHAPGIFETEAQKLRFVSDAVKALGMVRDKASEQEKIERVLRLVNKDKASEGLTPVASMQSPYVYRSPQGEFITVPAPPDGPGPPPAPRPGFRWVPIKNAGTGRYEWVERPATPPQK